MGPYDYQNNGGWPSPAVPQQPAYGWQPQAAFRPQMATPPPITNIELVTSLEEALIRTNQRNSDMLYLDQNKPILYRVKVDVNGINSHLQLPYTLPNQANNVPATQADIQRLLERIEALEGVKNPPVPQAASVGRKKKVEEVAESGESNG